MDLACNKESSEGKQVIKATTRLCACPSAVIWARQLQPPCLPMDIRDDATNYVESNGMTHHRKQ
eukprot:scaffold346326_cov51-Prasinocladus_malaysianus.AAC.1